MRIQDYPFNPHATEGHISTMESWLEENKNIFTSGVTSFGILGEKGFVNPHRNRGCHFEVANSLVKNRVLIGTEWGASRAEHKNYGYKDRIKASERFLDWFLNRSFAAPFLLGEKTRDTDWVTKKGGIIISADIPVPLLQNINITSRHGFEVMNHSFELFDEIVKLGYPEMAAYLFSVTLYASGENSQSGLKDVLSRLCTTRGGHRAWPIPYQAKVLNRLVNYDLGDTFDNKSETYRTSINFYGGVSYGRTKAEIRNVTIVRNGRNIFNEHESDQEYMDLLGAGPSNAPKIVDPFANTSMFGHNQQPACIPTVRQLLEVVLPYFKLKGYFDEYENNAEGKANVVDAQAA